jgi:transposase
MLDNHLRELADVASSTQEVPQDSPRARKSQRYVKQETLTIIKNMRQNGSSTLQISQALGLSLRSAQCWVAQIERDPETGISKKGRPRKDNAQLARELALMVGAEPAITAKGIAASLPRELRCSTATVTRQLKSMKYSRKRMKPIVAARNSEAVIQLRHEYCLQLVNIRDEDLIYIDETGFNMHTSPDFGYLPVGSSSWMTVPTQRGRNISMITAISLAGMISHFIIEGAFNTLRMGEWCRESLMPCIRGLTKVFVMDNARFHHAPLILDILRSEGSIVSFYLPIAHN